MKLLHVITSLKQGGAQTALRNLIDRMPLHDSHVIALLPDRTLVPALETAGASVTCVDLRRPDGFLRLAAAMRRSRPDVVQTWMHHADLVAGSIAHATRLAPVVWNIRNSNFERGGAPLPTRAIIKACARTSSRIPRKIVCVAESARAAHVAAGYDASRMVVIPNGFDVDLLRPDDEARRETRKALGITGEAIVMTLIARHHPMKDHSMFVRAAGLIATREPSARFVLAGDGVEWSNAALADAVRQTGHGDRFLLLGRRPDVAQLLNATDIACLSSAFGEGFPNVVGEAMSIGVPVVATTTGDTAEVVGDCGRLVQPRDAEAFAAACLDLITAGDEARRSLGARGRARIEARFSIESTVARYEELYASVLAAS